MLQPQITEKMYIASFGLRSLQPIYNILNLDNVVTE